MNLPFFLKGLLIGFSIAAPVGPIGVFCIQRTLTKGLLIGILTGFGAATADAVYGSIAAFGLTGISKLLINHQDLLRLGGGVFLVYLGLRTILVIPRNTIINDNGKNYLNAYTTTFFLTLTNPLTILSFLGIFAGLGIAANEGEGLVGAITLVTGVFIGSIIWWIVLSSITVFMKRKINTLSLIWVNRIAGIIILGFGFVALGSLKFS